MLGASGPVTSQLLLMPELGDGHNPPNDAVLALVNALFAVVSFPGAAFSLWLLKPPLKICGGIVGAFPVGHTQLRHFTVIQLRGCSQRIVNQRDRNQAPKRRMYCGCS